MGPPNLKKMLTVKLKPRCDNYCDQYSRIIMVKVLMVAATFTGLSWLKDKVTCIVPKNHDTTGGFVSKACWINGMYIYRDLPADATSYYYGIPADITNDGLNSAGGLCATKGPGASRSQDGFCNEMEKTFFLQYQWFPMGVVFLTALYYLPYLLFKFVNKDFEAMKLLTKGKKAEEVDYDTLIEKFFKGTGGNRALWRILVNIVVKILYVGANVVGLLVIDSALNGEFLSYGSNWLKWTDLPREKMYEYTNQINPKPGNTLLPSFALCQVRSEAQDIKTQYSNVHTYICELSQHILYQYVLALLWFMHVIGIVVSVFGLVKHMVKIIWNDCIPALDGSDVTKLYSRLSIRERELMDYIRMKNLPMFGELMKRIEQRYDTPKKVHDFDDDEKKPMINS